MSDREFVDPDHKLHTMIQCVEADLVEQQDRTYVLFGSRHGKGGFEMNFRTMEDFLKFSDVNIEFMTDVTVVELKNNYHPLENYSGGDADPLEDNSNGLWVCTCGDDPKEHVDFLEMHEANANREKMVFRVSTFSHGSIKLGSCAILDIDQLKQVRDNINVMLTRAALKEDEKGKDILWEEYMDKVKGRRFYDPKKGGFHMEFKYLPKDVQQDLFQKWKDKREE